MTTTTIPLEIFEEIINDLQSDIHALSSLSQSCRALLPHCQKRIFSFIKLGPKPQGRGPLQISPIVSFGGVLDSNPIIAQYVRELEFHITKSDPDALSVPHILDKLDRITVLTLIGQYHDWTALPPNFRQSLTDRIQSPGLSSLRISSFIGLPTNIFDICTNLTTLDIIDVEGGQQWDGNFIENVLPRLHSFAFDLANDYVPALLQRRVIPKLNELEKVEVDAEGADGNLVAKRIFSAASSLKTLIITFDDDSDGFIGLIRALNIASFATLRNLKLNIIIYDEGEDPLRGVCPELEVFPQTNVLETLEINIKIIPCCFRNTREDWGRFDDILSYQFPMLRKFLLQVEIKAPHGCGDVLQKKFEGLPGRQLPQLLKKQSVHFEYSIVS